jgi:hypothetical protein
MIVFICFVSVHFALLPIVENSMSDFSAFYYAAHIVLDPSVPNETLYDIDAFYALHPRYGAEEKPMPYIYSIPAAYLFSPLAILPFKEAKIVMNCISLVLYLSSVIIILYLGKAPARWFINGLAVSLAWLPFFENQHYLNTNALLLFLIALAVMAAVKERPVLSGFLLGIASLVKLFPIALALAMGLKNRRIFIACIIPFAVLIVLSGSIKWFSAMSRIKPIYTAAFQWLGPPYFILYVFIILGITSYILYRGRSVEHPLLVSFAIPAVFLIMPVVEYHHLTLLIFPFAYLLAKVDRLDRRLLAVLFFAIILVIVAYFFNALAVLSVFLFWVCLAIILIQKKAFCGSKPAEISNHSGPLSNL